MGYDSDSPSNDERDEDDEDEYEEAAGGNCLLGFMFGNVDNSGDLDVDYLDEDAKEHLAALADKLGPSLTGIDLSEKSPLTPSDATDQDASIRVGITIVAANSSGQKAYNYHSIWMKMNWCSFYSDSKG